MNIEDLEKAHKAQSKRAYLLRTLGELKSNTGFRLILVIDDTPNRDIPLPKPDTIKLLSEMIATEERILAELGVEL